MKVIVKEEGGTWYDAKTMTYHSNDIVWNAEDTYDVIPLYEGVIPMALHSPYMPTTSSTKYDNASHLIKQNIALSGLSQALSGSGCVDIDRTWWDVRSGGGAFKSNPMIPPIIGLNNMDDVRNLSAAVVRAKHTKVGFVGLMNLRYRDLSYNDGEVSFCNIDDYTYSDGYLVYVFSYGSSSNLFGIRFKDELKGPVDTAVIDMMVGLKDTGLTQDMIDFIAKCRTVVKGVANEI